MNILIAPDSLKGSLSAMDAARCIEKTLHALSPSSSTRTLPLSDGGEGALDLWSSLRLGDKVMAPTVDPLNRPIRAEYFRFHDGSAWVELSQASGLVLLNEKERDPLQATTFGTGLLIKHAIDAGAQKITLGLGGSATNDGGAGLLAALGYQLLDNAGNEVYPSGGNLNHIVQILPPKSGSASVEITVACDVNNPLCGPQGASAVYGPQKGAAPEKVPLLDENVRHWAELLEEFFKVKVKDVPGAGAAGGAGISLSAAFGARLRPGFDLLAAATNLGTHLEWADVVITAEGMLDEQSLYGKATVALCQMAKAKGCITRVFAGTVYGSKEVFAQSGIDLAVQIRPEEMGVEESMKKASQLLELAVITTFE